MEAPPSTPLDAALDLVRRLPPNNVVSNLSALLDLAPELTEELLTRVDQPLQASCRAPRVRVRRRPPALR